MGFIGGVPAPAIEHIIEQHAGIELLRIVAIQARQARGARRHWQNPAHYPPHPALRIPFPTGVGKAKALILQ